MSLKKQFIKEKKSCKVTFDLPKAAANGAMEVKVLGEFNNWNWAKGLPMKLKNGKYQAEIELKTGGQYQFRYHMDNGRWENDWAADQYVPTPFGVQNSVVVLEETVIKDRKKPSKKAAGKVPQKKDRFIKIEGIGPKIEKLLHNDGIHSFSALAKTSQKKLKSVLTLAGNRFKMHDPKSWPEQARLAAKQEWAKLKQMQQSLKGGRK